MSQKLTEDSFKWVEEISLFKECFKKSYNKDRNETFFLKLMFNILNFFLISQ